MSIIEGLKVKMAEYQKAATEHDGQMRFHREQAQMCRGAAEAIFKIIQENPDASSTEPDDAG